MSSRPPISTIRLFTTFVRVVSQPLSLWSTFQRSKRTFSTSDPSSFTGAQRRQKHWHRSMRGLSFWSSCLHRIYSNLHLTRSLSIWFASTKFTCTTRHCFSMPSCPSSRLHSSSESLSFWISSKTKNTAFCTSLLSKAKLSTKRPLSNVSVEIVA